MTTEIHVQFTRLHDAEDAFPTVAGRVSGARLAEAEIDVECEELDEPAVLHELEHALDEWLVGRELPFAPLQLDEHTLLVRPPGD
jgi:hypothetical protein